MISFRKEAAALLHCPVQRRRGPACGQSVRPVTVKVTVMVALAPGTV